MISIDLEPELEMTLEAVAKQEQSSPGEIIKRVTLNSNNSNISLLIV